MNWSEEQLQAIYDEGQNIIVSAGAGSGKTAVLSERVLQKVLRGIHVNELLVLTFTSAAAAEMKERIRKKIISNGLVEEANLIEGAYITTFDSFSLSMVKKYHTRLNITNKIAITDEVVVRLEQERILDEIMDEYYLNPTDGFKKLINDFCFKDDKELKSYIHNVYKKIELKYDKNDYLDKFFEIEQTDSKINGFIDEYVTYIFDDVKYINGLMDELGRCFDSDFMDKMYDKIGGLLASNSYEDIYNFFLGYDRLPTLPKNSPEEGKTLKETINNVIKEIKELCSYTSLSEMKDEITSTFGNSYVVIDLVRELNKRLESYKRENEIFTFNDIARLAIEVVEKNEDIREELKNSFNEILVDEYQDTSDTQEKFISLISHDNVYMVGDIKQSIYRFRNANPYIFKDKYDSYRDGTKKGKKIDLMKNFRSREEVLSNINTIFDLVMDDNIGGADYTQGHRMIFGNLAYNKEGKTSQDYNFEVLTYGKSEVNGITKDEQEAFIIGHDILDKINNHYQVFDKDEKILRDIEYKDFVLLLDRSKNFNLFKKIFEFLGIPTSILKEETLSKDNDILILKSLLKLIICIKNKEFDSNFKYNFMSVGRSYLFKMSDEELFDLFVENKYFDSDLYKMCLELVDEIDETSASSFLRLVLNKFNYEEKILTVSNIKALRIRIEYIYNLVKAYEKDGNTIYDFVEYLDKIFDLGYELKFNVNQDSSNSCKIMTIHKSKGLEFPICYFAGFVSRFNTLELKEKIIYDNKYGLVISKVDKYYKDTILKTLLKLNTKKEEISERIRLLYVAGTRAKEKMIFVVPDMEEEGTLIDMGEVVPLYQRSKYSSFYDLIKSIKENIINNVRSVDDNASKEYQASKKDVKLPSVKDVDDINVSEISISNEEIVEGHFSKDSLHLVSLEEQEVMDFGTKVHEVLELMNFKNNNLDKFNVSKRIKDKITSFLNSDLMRDKLDFNMYKEYEFIYEEDNKSLHGIIDLLVDCRDYLMIVDYKLKNIDDVNYDKQLNGYREFLKKKTGKDVKCYLYSILDEKYREVK